MQIYINLCKCTYFLRNHGNFLAFVKSQLSFLPLKGDKDKTEMQEEHLLMF